MDFLLSEKLYSQFFKCFSLLKYNNNQDLPISPGLIRLLAQIAECEKTNQKAIQEKFNIRASSVSGMLTKLENFGFITRERDTLDKRNVLLVITEKGKEIVDNHYHVQKAAAKEFFDILSEDEQKQLSTFVGKIIENQLDKN